MSAKKMLLVVLTTALLLAAVVGSWPAGPAQALPPVEQPNAAGVAIPYTGRLTNAAGLSVTDGAYDFTFTLYATPTGGDPLWTETQAGVTVQGGSFTTLLGRVHSIPADLLAGDERWLAVGVLGPGESDFTALTPRQQLSATTPTTSVVRMTSPACPHDHFGETWTGTGLGLALESSWPGNETLYVTNNATSGDAIRTYSAGAAYNDAALKGSNTSTGSGVYGYSSGGVGVYGKSSGSEGVHGETSANTWAAVAGIHTASSGSGAGVWGEARSSDAAGIVAYNTNTTGTALSIKKGAFEVAGAGVGTSTTVFIHQAHYSGGNANMCNSNSATVINHPLTNGDPNAILIVTVNGGTMGSAVAPPSPEMVVLYDANNQCGYGQRWLIINFAWGNAIPDNAKFNVMVVKP
jgi:hypothetical protein